MTTLTIPRGSLIRLVDLVSKSFSGLLRLLSFDLEKPRRVFRVTMMRRHLKDLPLSTQLEAPIQLSGTMNISIGENCRFSRDLELGTEEGGRIQIGNHVRINRGGTLVSYKNIRIGEHSLIGEFVSIRDANHGIRKGMNIREQGHHAEEICIGKDVWIGRGAVILPGVTIGDHCVIGANSVVTTSIPPHSIAVGSPAKVIRERY